MLNSAPSQPSAAPEAPRSAWRLVGALAVVALVGSACTSSTYHYDWTIFSNSLFAPNGQIVQGLSLTVSISIISQIVGLILGVFAAIGKLSRFLPFRLVANFYIWVFRGTPLLVQLMLIFFGMSSTGIYKWPPIVIGGFAISGAVQAGIFVLGVNEGAYMAEIVRAGIISIDTGQMEAAKSLGMTYSKAMRRIVLPQAARVIVPPLGNEFNNMLKTTSLLVILAVPELFVTFENLNGSGDTSFHPFELFLAAAVWYLLLTTIWGIIQARIETRLARGTPGSQASSDGPTMRARVFGARSPTATGH